MPALNALYRRYQDRVAFYVVYIEEAHPIDFWQMPVNAQEGVLVHSTNTAAERSGVAETCVLRLGIEPPAVIDGADDRVERAYAGWPDRLYLIDTKGRIAFKSVAGPFGFEPQNLERAIRGVVFDAVATR